MEIYAPSESYTVEKSTMTEDGLIWTGIWEVYITLWNEKAKEQNKGNKNEFG